MFGGNKSKKRSSEKKMCETISKNRKIAYAEREVFQDLNIFLTRSLPVLNTMNTDILQLRIRLLREELDHHQKNYMELLKSFNHGDDQDFRRLNTLRENITILKIKLKKLVNEDY